MFKVAFLFFEIILLPWFLIGIGCLIAKCHSSFKESLPYLIGAIAISTIISLFLGFCCDIVYKDDIEKYNNGYCTECGNQLKLYDIEKRGYRSYWADYYYQCEECSHLIVTHFNMND